jgi:hypothetical protein
VQFCSLVQECSPKKSRKSDSVPQRKVSSIKQIRSQCQCDLFGQTKQQRDLFKKWLLDWA